MGLAGAAFGQAFTQRGFIETDFIGYPQAAPNDSGQEIGEALFRYEAFYKLNSDWQFAGGIDARADTHEEVDRIWELSWDDRERRRPSFEVRQLNATYSKKKLTVVLGKQFVRWGKADILNPTDRFAPQDYLTVVDTDFLIRHMELSPVWNLDHNSLPPAFVRAVEDRFRGQRSEKLRPLQRISSYK